MKEAELRNEIARLAKPLFDRGYSVGSAGNLSVALDDGYLVTPTNSSLGHLDPDSISRVDRIGRHIAGLPPSKELPLHLAFFASLSLRELVEITEMRQIAEAEAFRRSVEKGDEAWESEVVAGLHRLTKAINAYAENGDKSRRLEFEDRHRGFHRILVSGCGNSRLLQTVEALHQHLIRYRQIFLLTELGADDLRFMHQELMRVSVERDVESAASIMRRHVRVNVDQVREGLKAKPELKALIDIE